MDIDGQVRAEGGELLYSVFCNLLENDLQHTESATPQIRVSTAVEGEAVAVTFDDDGPGLPDTVRDQIVGRDSAQPTSGTHIVRSLMELYDGDITVDTGKSGTTITVRLPRSTE